MIRSAVRALLLFPLAASVFPTVTAADTSELRVAWRIRLVDPAGSPISGAEVVHHDEANVAGGASVAFTESEPGLYLARGLPFPTRGVVRVRRDGIADTQLQPVLARLTDGSVDLGVTGIGPAERCELRVVDGTDGAAIPGAKVYAVEPGAPFPPRDLGDRRRTDGRLAAANLLTVTDADGRAVVHLALGDRRVVVTAPARAPSFATLDPSALTPLIAEEGHRARISIEASADARRLLGPEVDIDVSCGGWRWIVPAPRRSSIELALPPGLDATLRVDERGFERAVTRVSAADSEAALTLRPLPELAWLRIDARSTTGVALADLEVALGRARDDAPDRIDFVPDWNARPITIDDGALFAAPRGPYDVLISAYGHRQTLHRRVSVTGSRERPGRFDASLPPAPPVRGVVIDASSGRPIEGASVIVRRRSRDLDGLPRLWSVAGTVGFVAATSTDARGRFDVVTSAWESLEFEVEADGYAIAVQRVARDASDGLIIPMQPGVAVRGRTDPPHDPPPFAPHAFLALAHGDVFLRAPIQADGSFRFDHVPPGDHRLYVDRDDRTYFTGAAGSLAYALVARTHRSDRGSVVRVSNEPVTAALEVEPPTPRPVDVIVQLTSGVTGGSVFATRADPSLRTTDVSASMTGSHARMPPIAEGPYWLVATDGRDDPIGLSRLDAAYPGGLVHASVGLGALLIRAAPKVEITATFVAPTGANSLARVVPAARWSHRGHVRIASVLPGTWRIEWRESGVQRSRTVEVEPGAITSVTVEPTVPK